MTTAAEPLRGLALLDAAIAHIVEYPETWDQEDFRCESGMCVAGWGCELAGGQWYSADPSSQFSWYLLAEPGDLARHIQRLPDGTAVVTAETRARRLFGAPARFFDDGLRDGEPGLFAGANDLDDIIRIRDEIAEWFASQDAS